MTARDPARIRPFLDLLAQAWEKYPDARFAQLLCRIQDSLDLDTSYEWEEGRWAIAIHDLLDPGRNFHD